MDNERKKGNPVTGVLAALFGIYLLYGIGSSTMDRYTVTSLTAHMKTACVGRFLIDLPASMDYSHSRAYMDGLWISGQEETQQAFEARVLARQAAIDAVPNQQGKKNMEKIEAYDNNGFTGKIFIFGRDITKGEENGKPVDWVNVALEAYVHSHGKSFTFTTDAYDVDLTGDLRRLIDKLRLVSEKEIPTAAGFCFGPGMFVDPLPADFTEGVTLFAGFPDHPDLAMALDTRAGLGPRGPGPLDRYERVRAEEPLWQKPLFKELRKRKRKIDKIEGDEILIRGNELNFVTVYAFDWEVYGTQHDVFVPFMHLEISTGHPVHAGARPVTSFLGEEALIQLWDKIMSSLRARPTGDAPSAKREPPPGPKLGDSASAGDVCPETGWWECKDGGKDASVAGGQRQFMKKGERMPQALLLQPQTVWDKLRGVQASYRREQPTGWTLTDRRSRKRLAPAAQLAAAGPANGNVPKHDRGHMSAIATTDGFAGTGVPCPASGWWRCEDTDALDGTRWFAQGELLPPASFQIPGTRFRPSANTEVFQRRSRWQLVRQAPGHDSESAAS
jgi:hypothetical protein